MTAARAAGVEVERKFDADDTIELPPLHGIDGVAAVAPPVEQQLEATYFDTADLRLARAGVTLRRRTGGSDDGWHLKLPVGKDERLEVRRPLGRAVRTVPKSLAGLVRAYVRDQPLQIVATLSTRRAVHRLLDADGDVLAEVADDKVSATAVRNGHDSNDSHDGNDLTAPLAARWRELEVELVGGGRELLAAVGDRLLAAGLTPAHSGSKLRRLLADRAVSPALHGVSSLDSSATAGDVVRGYLAEQATALMAWDPRARMDEPDGVHKMRVATRRLRSALATYRKLLDDSATEPLRAELKWLGGVLGEPRDAEVMHDRLRQLVGGLPAELVLGPVRRRIDMTLRARHRDAHARLVRELDGPRYLQLLDDLDTMVREPPLVGDAARSATTVLPAYVARTRKRVLRRAAAARDAQDSKSREQLLHDVRKAAKRARYAAESVTDLVGSKATRFAERMEHLQEVLGEHQDGIVTQDLIRQLGVEAHGRGENGFTFGVLHGIEHGRAERAEREYADALAAVSGKRPKWLR